MAHGLNVHQDIAELRAELASTALTKAERAATEVALEAALDLAELERVEADQDRRELQRPREDSEAELAEIFRLAGLDPDSG
jgi:hypothetical protein